MIISDRNIKVWSSVGPRATYGLAIMELAKTEEKLIIVTSDTSTSAGLDRFKRKHPEKYFDIGIAEQNTLGVASGLANEGFITFVSTFAPFQSMRCLEQIKVNLAYMQIPLNVVGLASGVNLGHLGYTHCCIEDIGVLRSLPNLTIISPADSLETAKAVYSASQLRSPTYIRLTGDNKTPQVNNEDYNYIIGNAIQLLAGESIAVVASGAMVGNAKLALLKLKDIGINLSLYNFHTIKPIDKNTIKKIAKKYKLVVSIEEHNTIGGLGTALSENLITQNTVPKLLKWGIEDTYVFTGSYEDILLKAGLTIEKITSNLRKEYNKL